MRVEDYIHRGNFRLALYSAFFVCHVTMMGDIAVMKSRYGSLEDPSPQWIPEVLGTATMNRLMLLRSLGEL